LSFIDRPDAGNKALLLHVHLESAEGYDPGEFNELTRSLGLDVVAEITASRRTPHPRWFVGSGKVEELERAFREADADILLVDQELSAGQQRNLEKRLDARVMTRTEVILQIFSERARTFEGQLQVELAQLKHAQTRLVRGWTHLDRQKGGVRQRGAGETQIELDQRMLAARIRATERRLARVQKRRAQGRRRRHRTAARTVSLVGYTNAGKSTLFNALTDGEALVQNKLFATLDPTMRKLSLPGLEDVVLADTVGFVSRLPHSLVEAFKATLEEVSNADLLLHVVDASYPQCRLRIEQVEDVLREIGAEEIPCIFVLNKADLVTGEVPVLQGIEAPVLVSALEGSGLDLLCARIAAALGVLPAPVHVVLAPDAGSTRARLYALGAVLDESVTEDGRIALRVQADQRLLEDLRREPRCSVASVKKG
jgi:GTP-binding protein HflX